MEFGKILLIYYPTQDIATDFFTKALKKVKYYYLYSLQTQTIMSLREYQTSPIIVYPAIYTDHFYNFFIINIIVIMFSLVIIHLNSSLNSQ